MRISETSLERTDLAENLEFKFSLRAKRGNSQMYSILRPLLAGKLQNSLGAVHKLRHQFEDWYQGGGGGSGIWLKI